MNAISLFALPPFLSAILIAVIGLYVVLKNPRSETHRALGFFCLSLVVWLFFYTLMYSSTEDAAALQWAKMGFSGIAFIALTNLYFNMCLIKFRSRKIYMLVFLGISTFFAVAGKTDLLYSGIGKFYWGYYPQAGKLYVVFMSYYIALWFFGLHLLYQNMLERKKSQDFLSYNQIKYVFIAWLGGSLGIVDFLPKYGVPIYPFAYMVALYWVLISMFAVTRYKLLADIYFITRRFLITSLFVVILAGLFGSGYLCIYFLRDHVHIQSFTFLVMALSVGIGLAAQTVYRRIKNLIDRIFFPEYFELKEKLSRLGQEILLSKTPLEFNRLILENIFSSFKIIKASLFVWNEQDRVFTLQAAGGWGMQSQGPSNLRLEAGHPIAHYLETNEHLLLDSIRQDFSSAIDQRSLALAMYNLEASLAIPIMSEKKLLGFFALGDKESGLPYGKEDLKSIKILAKHTAGALENLDLTQRWNDQINHNQQMNDILHRYMSPSIADEVLKMVNHVQSWKGDRRYVSILMSDLRGFTSLSDKYSPEEVVQWLNEYFSEMVEIIISHGGTVDKFMGDGVLVVFGAPSQLKNPEFSAVSCAIEMRNALAGLNRKRQGEHLTPLEMGIAISAGEVIAGNIGSDKRMEYTVIGDAVNIASRLQAVAGSGKILATSNVIEKVIVDVDYVELSPIQVRGKSQPISAVEITGFRKTLGEQNYRKAAEAE